MSAYLSVTNISKSYAYHHILSDVSLIVNAGERVGLVGANGAGKSTLLKIIMGEVEADGGTVMIPPDMRLGYLEQTITAAGEQTLEALIAESMRHLYDLESRLRDLEQQMSAVSGAALDAVMDEYGDLSERFERAGGYDLDYRVDTILTGLGVAHIPRSRYFSTLSGGEKARVGLGLLLLGSPDILLLDEPTNHLDSASLNWLEGYLGEWRGGMLVVSHDRQFLNGVVNAIVEIDEHSHTAKRYVGSYDAYLAAKRLERRKWEQDYANQQEEIKQLKLDIKVTARNNNNFRVHKDNDKFVINTKKETHASTVAKRIHVAEEKLKRIEANPIPQPPPLLRFDPEFDPVALKGNTPMFVSGVCKRFGERMVLDGVSLTLRRESRVLLVGPNGAGKSTLLKILAGIEKPDSGEIYLNPRVKVGYLDQEQDTLDPDMTLFEAYSAGLTLPEQALKAALLHSGLFRYEQIGKQVKQLSVGQQRKLQIARLIIEGANLLVLDEPTNYVSFDVLEELEAALRVFPGPVVAASHDRRFIAQFGGEVWEVRDGRLHEEKDTTPNEKIKA